MSYDNRPDMPQHPDLDYPRSMPPQDDDALDDVGTASPARRSRREPVSTEGSLPAKSYAKRYGMPPLPGRIDFGGFTEMAIRRGVVIDFGVHEGRPNLSAIQRGTGLAYTTLFPWLRDPEGVKMISMDTLARVCAFLDCQPGDILKYVPDAHPTVKSPISDENRV